jgi:hypothetical protein
MVPVRWSTDTGEILEWKYDVPTRNNVLPAEKVAHLA